MASSSSLEQREPTSAPYPPRSSSANIRPISYISSRITDIVSEDGESNPPTATSSPSRRAAPPPSRNVFLEAPNQHGRRPNSGGRVSRTHIPSLTAHGFFRPMSSQRLQAQRAGRPTTNATTVASIEDVPNDEESQRRRSIISSTTAPLGNSQEHELPPPSRGTEFTDPVMPDRGTSNASPTGNTTIRSLGDSVRLLHDRTPKPVAPSHMPLGNQNGTHEPPQKSPLSFRSGFLRGSRSEQPSGRDSHARLSPSPASASQSEETSKTIKPPKPMPTDGKNYEYFTGNTAFFAGGRLQNSRDRPANIATGITVVVPGALFLAYSGPWLWHNVSPALPIVFGYLFLICFSSFVHASAVDPGILPRNLHIMPPADPDEDPLTLGPPKTDWVMTKPKPGASDVAAMAILVKFCDTCNIWRPPRCYHCRVCNNCVENLDHHCVWLNNCVGRRNYRYFFGFIGSAVILGLLLFGASLAHILLYQSREGISFAQSIDKWRVPFAMVLYGAIATPYPTALWCYHLFLVGRGQTTREYLSARKMNKPDRHRAFNQGSFFKNLVVALGRPRPPTYLQFKNNHYVGDQRFATHKVNRRRHDLEAQEGDLELSPGKQTGLPRFEGPAARGALPTPPTLPQNGS
ncbi:Eukaryotic peptide chain release factor GTP-binding subunit [Myotisia sp. PD_48]|nr:Eukaryotic peptide chain release factor GTP-binding subunit [Myotisia sp. PD_48]